MSSATRRGGAAEHLAGGGADVVEPRAGAGLTQLAVDEHARFGAGRGSRVHRRGLRSWCPDRSAVDVAVIAAPRCELSRRSVIVVNTMRRSAVRGRWRPRPPRHRRPGAAPHSPRSCATPSARKLRPCSRPSASWPPWVFSGRTPPGPIVAAAVDPIAEFPDAAEPHRLDPRQRDVGEPVVELRDVDIGRGHRRPLPHGLRTALRSAEEEVVGVGPVRLPPGAHRDRVDPHRRLRRVGSALGRW